MLIILICLLKKRSNVIKQGRVEMNLVKRNEKLVARKDFAPILNEISITDEKDIQSIVSQIYETVFEN